MSIKVLLLIDRGGRSRFNFIKKPLRNSKIVSCTACNLKISSFFSLNNFKKYDFILFTEPNFLSLLFIAVLKYIYKKIIVYRIGGDIYYGKQIQKSLMYYYLNKQNFYKAFKTIIGLLYIHLGLVIADSIIALSDFHKKRITTQHKKPIAVIPQPIRLQFENIREFDFESGTFNLLTVTNLKYEQKKMGVIQLINYFDTFTKTNLTSKKVTLKIVGDGLFSNEIEYLLKTIQNDNIIFCGYSDNVDKFYSKSHIFLYSSFADILPNVLLDALCYGMPILINNFDPFSGILVDKKNALFFESNQQFNEQLNLLLTNKNLFTKLSINNFQKAKNDFGVEVVRNKLETFFTSAII